MPSKTMSVVALAAIVGATAAAYNTTDDDIGVRRLTVDFEYVGCYLDGTPPDDPIMGVNMTFDGIDGMTTEWCAENCEDVGFYFGTKSGIECFCGDESTDFEYYGPGTCNYPCGSTEETEDFEEEMCGGFMAMSVYQYNIGVF